MADLRSQLSVGVYKLLATALPAIVLAHQPIKLPLKFGIPLRRLVGATRRFRAV